ncbi:MAG: RNB domain-containing ribonuclease, partial [Rhodoferax sp.]
MPNNNRHHHRADLVRIAIQAMLERGLEPEFPVKASRQLAGIAGAATVDADETVQDLTRWLWCSLDNDDSEDLDQLTVSETLPDGKVKILVAIADVDALVKKDSPIDLHAETNTTSVYT